MPTATQAAADGHATLVTVPWLNWPKASWTLAGSGAWAAAHVPPESVSSRPCSYWPAVVSYAPTATHWDTAGQDTPVTPRTPPFAPLAAAGARAAAQVPSVSVSSSPAWPLVVGL